MNNGIKHTSVGCQLELHLTTTWSEKDRKGTTKRKHSLLLYIIKTMNDMAA